MAALGWRLFLSPLVFHPDVFNHIDWGIRFWQYGPASFYDQNIWSFTWPNQPPGSIYLFALMRKIYEVIYQFFWWLNISIRLFPSGIMFWLERSLYPVLLKMPTIIADLGIGWLIYRFLAKEKGVKIAFLALALWLFNPATFYNSAVWGQTDALINFLMFWAILALLKRKLLLGVNLFTFSLFFKLSLAIFFPVFLLVVILQRYRWRDYLLALISPLVWLIVLTLPFSAGENPLAWLAELYRTKIFGQQYHVVTANAFNLWAVVFGFEMKSDLIKIGIFSLKTWAIAAFGLLMVPVFLHLKKDFSKRTILVSYLLVAYGAFIILTNMHERYLYPVFPYLLLLAAYSPALFKIYFALSAIHLINLYHLWWVPRVEPLVIIFTASDTILLRGIALINVLLFFFSYRFLLRRS